MQAFLALSVVVLCMSSVCTRSPPAKRCITTMEHAPVCGRDGKVYGNKGQAACAEVRVDYPCPQRQLTPKLVCGKDGKTYANACEFNCAKAKKEHDGKCNDCVCADIYEPVCGTNGKTYGNKCEARCAGVKVRREGKCRRDA